jgi:arsenate reductase
MRDKVLFICVHNSGRSQIAEGYLRKLCGDRFEVESAGLEPRAINPLIIEVMKEEGIDLTMKKPQSAFDLFRQGKLYSYVITVCEADVEEKCPIFPGITRRLNWPFPDPSKAEGTPEEKLYQVRIIRDQIKERIVEFCRITK